MKLSDHFSLAELTVTGTGLKNDPPPNIIERLIITADYLEKVREVCGGNPVIVSSGWRSDAVNKKVGGVHNSDHRSGYAVDFTIPRFGTPYRTCAMVIAAGIPFDQLIHERRKWVHISFAPAMRGQVLTLPVHGKEYLGGLHK